MAVTAIAQDVQRFLVSLSRTSRSRALYAANNETLRLMKNEMWSRAQAVFRQVDELTLQVRPSALIYKDSEVYAEEDTGTDGLPFVLYRDGIRRLDLTSGVTLEELEQLVEAIHRGGLSRSIEDDVVAQLWRRDLEHIRYVTIDVNAADAAEEGLQEQQVEAVMRSLFSDAPSGSPFHGLNLDAAEVAAKAMAETLGRVDEMAPGLYPPASLPSLPAYSGRLRQSEDDEASPLLRMPDDIVRMLGLSRDPETEAGFDALLQLIDVALVEEDLELATRIVRAVRQLVGHESAVGRWLDEAMSDARLRQVIAVCQVNHRREREVRDFFEACGRRGVKSLIRSLSTFKQPAIRRRFADLCLELGVDDLDQVRDLVQNEQGFAAREAIYLLGRLDQLRNRHLLRDVQRHPRPQVRLELINEIDRVPDDIASHVLVDLLRDQESRVRVAAAETLSQRGDALAIRALASTIDRPEFDEEPEGVKRAVMIGLAECAGVRAVPNLEPLLHRAEGWMPKRSVEDTAVVAVKALRQMRNAEAVRALRDATRNKNRTVRDAARAALQALKGAT